MPSLTRHRHLLLLLLLLLFLSHCVSAGAAAPASPCGAPYGLVPIHHSAGDLAVPVSWRRRPGIDGPASSEVALLHRNGSVVLLSLGDGEGARIAAASLAPSSTLAYRARVRCRDNGAWSPWSAPAPWHVAPHAGAAWPGGAAWICVSPVSSRGLSASLLRADFALPAGRSVAAAALHIVGLGQFRVFINGADVLGAEFTAPGQTAWGKRVLFSTYNVADFLLAGQANALGVELGNGMFNVPAPTNGRYTKWSGSSGPRQLLAALVVTLDDGSNATFATAPGGAWTGTDAGPLVFSHEYAGEDFDANFAVPGWAAPGFDPAASNPRVAWAPAAACAAEAPAGVLEPSTIDAIAVVAELPALSIVPSSPPGTLLVDVGKNFAGFAVVNLSSVPPGATVRVWPSETMVAGAIQQASGGTPTYWQHTTNASGGAADVTLAPHFFTYGWRWLAVQVLPPPPTAAAAADNGTITVLQATYGGNCGAAAGDETAAVAAWCGAGARPNCTFRVCVCGDNLCGAGDPPCLPDPAQSCAKEFDVTWRCTLDAPGSNRSLVLPAEADNAAAQLGCGPPPPPPPEPNVTGAAGYFVRAAAPTVGSWSCSNPWVNRIFAITLEAIAANLQSVLTDCPHRERLGWLEVSHLMFPSIAYNFDVARLWAKIARDTVDSQLESGMVPDIAPEYVVFDGGFRDSPEWGSAAVLNPAMLYEWSGDLATLNATYATGARYVDYLLARRDAASGLLTYGLGDWIPVEPSPPGVTATGVLVQDLRALATAAAALGMPAAAANYTRLAEEVAAAFLAAFARPSYPTQAAAGFALSLNMTPAADVPAAQAYLVGDVVARGNVTTSGEIGNRYALLALAEAPGGRDAVWASLLRQDSPGYGWMLTRGETALAESWTDAVGDSHIHAMYGHISEYLYRFVTGISQAPGSIAWRHVVIAPHLPAGLSWANASFDSPRGRVLSAVADAGGGAVELEVEVPPGVRLEVVLPRSGARVQLSGGERHRLRDERREQ